MLDNSLLHLLITTWTDVNVFKRSDLQRVLHYFNDNDNDNENTLFDHNIHIEITIYKQFK